MNSQHDSSPRVLPQHHQHDARAGHAVQTRSIAAPLHPSHPAHERITTRRLDTAFQRLVAHLPTLPAENRCLWSNRRRASNALACPGTDAITACQIALEAAIQGGNLRTIEATALEVEAFVDELRMAALAPYLRMVSTSTSTEPALTHVGLSGIKEGGEAATAIATALATRQPTDLDRAIHEVTEAIGPFQKFCEGARQLLSARPREQHRVIAR